MSERKPRRTFVFDTQELCDLFLDWLSDGGGEQDFFGSCEYHGVPVEGIDYWQGDDTVLVTATPPTDPDADQP